MRAALAFLTVLGPASPPDARAVVWFPAVGAALGGALGLLWTQGDELWAPVLVAALVVAADLALTGLLHLDGLADSADGLLPHLDRDRRLAVMAEPAVGAFGAGAVATVLLVRFSALAAAEPSIAVLAAVWCASRTTMAVATATVPYARDGGLAAGFRGAGPVPVLVVAALLVGATALADPGRVAAAVVGTLAAGAAVVALARRRVGGFTGDVLGAAGLVGETVGLVVAAARW